jgi:hypothetical protein
MQWLCDTGQSQTVWSYMVKALEAITSAMDRIDSVNDLESALIRALKSS